MQAIIHISFLFALMAACISLSSAQQIFYPALKARQISVFANGRPNAVTSVALATPLPATRDAQGRRNIQRQTAGGLPVEVQQFQPVGGQQLQPLRGPQLQQIGVAPFQQFQRQQLQRVGGGGSPPTQQFARPQVQRVGSGGPQFQQFQGQQLQRIGRVGSSPIQQFGGQQLLQGGLPVQQFRGQQVQKIAAGEPSPLNLQRQQIQQFGGPPLPQVWEHQYDRPVVDSPQIYFNTVNSPPYSWQPTNWQYVGK